MKKAIEFVTHKKNNRTIEIPEEYADEVSGEFRVILILDAQPQKKVPCERKFEAVRIKTQGFKFNRDEIYEEE
jgi:hypothetical protein